MRSLLQVTTYEKDYYALYVRIAWKQLMSVFCHDIRRHAWLWSWLGFSCADLSGSLCVLDVNLTFSFCRLSPLEDSGLCMKYWRVMMRVPMSFVSIGGPDFREAPLSLWVHHFVFRKHQNKPDNLSPLYVHRKNQIYPDQNLFRDKNDQGITASTSISP